MSWQSVPRSALPHRGRGEERVAEIDYTPDALFAFGERVQDEWDGTVAGSEDMGLRNMRTYFGTGYNAYANSARSIPNRASEGFGQAGAGGGLLIDMPAIGSNPPVQVLYADQPTLTNRGFPRVVEMGNWNSVNLNNYNGDAGNHDLGWGDLLYGGPDTRYNMHGGAAEGTSASQVMTRGLMTLCMEQNAMAGNKSMPWELQTFGRGPAMHYTFFPVVRKLTNTHPGAGSAVAVNVVMYAVVYSNFVPGEGISFFPRNNWAEVRGVYQQIKDGLYVDARFVRGPDAQFAITAALTRWDPTVGAGGNEWFVTIVPVVTPDEYEQYGGPRGWTFTGTSLGLATLAVIMGSPSVAYTGAIKTFDGGRTNKDAVTAMARGEDGSRRIVTVEGSDRQRVSWEFADIGLAAPIVDPVDDLPYKIMTALRNGWPLVIPYSDDFRRPLRQQLSNIRNANSYMKMVMADVFYGPDDLMDGLPVSASGSPIFVAVTAIDAMTLAAAALCNFGISRAYLRDINYDTPARVSLLNTSTAKSSSLGRNRVKSALVKSVLPPGQANFIQKKTSYKRGKKVTRARKIAAAKQAKDAARNREIVPAAERAPLPPPYRLMPNTRLDLLPQRGGIKGEPRVNFMNQLMDATFASGGSRTPSERETVDVMFGRPGPQMAQGIAGGAAAASSAPQHVQQFVAEQGGMGPGMYSAVPSESVADTDWQDDNDARTDPRFLGKDGRKFRRTTGKPKPKHTATKKKGKTSRLETSALFLSREPRP